MVNFSAEKLTSPGISGLTLLANEVGFNGISTEWTNGTNLQYSGFQICKKNLLVIKIYEFCVHADEVPGCCYL